MNELIKTDRRNVGRPDPGRFRARRGLFVRASFLGLMMIITLGNRGCEQKGDPNLECSSVSMRVGPGTCTSFQNPCLEQGWVTRPTQDGFRLEPTDEQRGLITAAQVSVRTTRDADETTRSICVAAEAPLFFEEEIPFLYGHGPDFGTGDLILTVAPELTVNATASPSTIAAGESTQLLATVSGGIPPYFYSWVPASTLNDEDIAAPTATPGFTTTYTVGVIDSGGQRKASSVTVLVDFAVAVTANPDLINLGETSQLEANVVGGVPPFTFSWTPTVGLNDPLRSDPLAAPTTTTTYTALVTDATGATTQGSATVRIRDSIPLTADFVYQIVCCPTVELDASASTGNIVSYTWDLSWTPKARTA